MTTRSARRQKARLSSRQRDRLGSLFVSQESEPLAPPEWAQSDDDEIPAWQGDAFPTEAA